MVKGQKIELDSNLEEIFNNPILEKSLNKA
jgi:hypothetical protein